MSIYISLFLNIILYFLIKTLLCRGAIEQTHIIQWVALYPMTKRVNDNSTATKTNFIRSTRSILGTIMKFAPKIGQFVASETQSLIDDNTKRVGNGAIHNLTNILLILTNRKDYPAEQK